MPVQDDQREIEVINLLGLKKGSDRSGVDAYFTFQNHGINTTIDIELKSTTNSTVSTARDVGLDHINKWRSKYWIIAYYDKSGSELKSLLGLSPEEMEPWIKSIEDYILPDFLISKRASEKLTLNDLYEVCGQKSFYSVGDARKLHKQQWNSDQYVNEQDITYGYSSNKMLEILKLRSKYISERGSTLNNPHITQSFLNNYSHKLISKEQILVPSIKASFLSNMTQSWVKHISDNH